MKRLVAALAALLLPLSLSAQTPSPVAERSAIALPGTASTGDYPEIEELTLRSKMRIVRNVTHATITPVLPAPGTGNGTAVIVAPGGGYTMLAWELEGTSIAQALTRRGITAFILKYHLVRTPTDTNAFYAFGQQRSEEIRRTGKVIAEPHAADDALAAIALVRARATEWKIDPARVGIIGFSAGAMTALNASLKAEPGKGPDFLGYIYGPMTPRAVPASAPPLFAAIAFDDPLLPPGGFELVQDWHKAGRPVELHAYAKGGHGFGPGKPGTTTVMLMPEFLQWLESTGFLPVTNDTHPK